MALGVNVGDKGWSNAGPWGIAMRSRIDRVVYVALCAAGGLALAGCGDDSAANDGGGGSGSATTTTATIATAVAVSSSGSTSSSPSAGGGGPGGGGQGGEGGAGCVVDDLFCNGIERIVNGACVKVPANPCDDDEPCTEDLCDEETDRCSHEVAEDDCATCFAEACEGDCTDKECGDDGCGVSCGECGDGEGCASITGQCQSAAQSGTCGLPIPLVLVANTTTAVSGDTTDGLHEAIPTCNSTSTAVEQVYEFTLLETMGIDARSSLFDTVLHIRTDCLENDDVDATVACSDDASPPGDYGSRVSVVLDPGTYYLIVDGFDSASYGPYDLTVKAVPDCAPSCDGVYCGGDDGCGGDCGTCDDGFLCTEQGRCRPDPCVPDCTNDDDSERLCGDDGCGDTCGTCAGDAVCVDATGTCETFPECDHESPACDGGCEDDQFCGTDCACHDLDAPLPDLVVDADRLADEILFSTETFTEASCAVAEGCVGGTGERRLLRFSVEAVNQGQVTLTVPPPAERPDLFQFSACHGHYHFNGFAEYALEVEDGTVIAPGRKQAYCMEDTEQVLEGPGIGCVKEFDCENQGIQAGWSDLYGNALDCQWLDITDVKPGDYFLRVTVNPNLAFEEISVDNNTARVPVTIP